MKFIIFVVDVEDKDLNNNNLKYSNIWPLCLVVAILVLIVIS